MRQNIFSILLAGATLVALTGCEKEATFNMNPGEGQLNCRTLNVDYINNNKTRAENVELGDFVVDFVNTATNETVKSYKYSEMPEIVSLPAGNYRAEAQYGENPVAEWEAPYYLGNSDFGITAGEITDDVAPVECVLSNIRVRVDITDLNLGLLGEDAQVVVEAGKEGSLTYDLSTTDKSGYFRFVDGSSTLIAKFYGTVDGKKVGPTTLTFDNVESGNSYDINFTVNRPDNMEPGYIVIGGEPGSEITLNAKITIIDQTKEIDPNEPDDNILEDDMRPVNGDDPNGDDPNGDDPNGDEPGDEVKGPKITILSEGMELNKKINVDKLIIDKDEEEKPIYYLAFDVTSETGIMQFKINIDSSTLTPDELESVELTNNLDLVNPGEFKGKLEGLGFPTEANVEGQTSCHFDISKFIPLLNMLGSGIHTFNLTVSDANGTTTGAIIIEN